MNRKIKMFLISILCIAALLILNACEKVKTEQPDTSSNKESVQNVYEPASSFTTHTMNCIVNEITENHFIVEKLNGKERSGVLYQFDYNSEQFNVGDEIVVEFKYPIANSIPYGLTDVNIYKSE